MPRLVKGIVIWLVATVSSCSNLPPVQTPQLGSDLNTQTGKITRTNLTFSFQRPDPEWTVAKFFDHIYFEGDTLCFSCPVQPHALDQRFSAWYIYKDRKMPAERTGKTVDHIWGFSLIGSLLEQIYPELLEKQVKDLSLPLSCALELQLEYSTREFHTNIYVPVSFTIQ